MEKINNETVIVQKRIQDDALDELSTLKATVLEEESFKAQVVVLVDEELKEEAEQPVPPDINIALLPSLELLSAK